MTKLYEEEFDDAMWGEQMPQHGNRDRLRNRLDFHVAHMAGQDGAVEAKVQAALRIIQAIDNAVDQ